MTANRGVVASPMTILTYTDWRRENYFSALQERLGGVRRLGIEFDHVSLEMRPLLEATFPAKELINVAQAAMRLRTIKSEREHALIHEGARICRAGGDACIAAVRAGAYDRDVKKRE